MLDIFRDIIRNIECMCACASDRSRVAAANKSVVMKCKLIFFCVSAYSSLFLFFSIVRC